MELLFEMYYERNVQFVIEHARGMLVMRLNIGTSQILVTVPY